MSQCDNLIIKWQFESTTLVFLCISGRNFCLTTVFFNNINRYYISIKVRFIKIVHKFRSSSPRYTISKYVTYLIFLLGIYYRLMCKKYCHIVTWEKRQKIVALWHQINRIWKPINMILQEVTFIILLSQLEIFLSFCCHRVTCHILYSILIYKLYCLRNNAINEKHELYITVKHKVNIHNASKICW